MGFLKQFMSWTASHVATKRALWGLYRMEGFIGRKRVDQEVKSGLFQARTPFLGGRQGVSPGRLIH